LNFNGERSYSYLQKLAVELGPRPSGTEAEKKAAEWILKEFHDFGFDAHIEEFDVITGKVISQKLEVIEPYNMKVN